MKLRITHHESSWLRIIGGIGVIVAAVLLVRPFLPASYHPEEPLAEADSLSLLMQGRQLPEPPMESSAQFHGLKSSPSALIPIRNVLGDTSSEKRIEVDLTNQKVYAYEGERKVYEFIVSTGKWAHTPTGEFRIWAKVRSQKMSGGDKSL
ncbi:MAG: L,D-transpeptidase family protein, partial [Patescibacteria group bacterium]